MATINLETATEDLSFRKIEQLHKPLCSLFKKNSLVETLNGTLSVERNSIANVVDRNGLVYEAAIDTPREDGEGWLMEGPSENLCLYSEEIDNGSWAKENITVATGFSAPDGSSTAEKLTDTAVTDLHRIYQVMTITSGVEATFSCFAKAGTYEDLLMEDIITGGSSASNTHFNLTSGTIVSGEGTITAMGDGWYRLTKQYTTTGTTFVPQIAMCTDIGNLTYLGAVEYCYVWGCMVEELSFASSYIATTTTSETRVADSHLVPTSENIVNPEEDWTIALKVKMLGLQIGVHQRIFDVDVGTPTKFVLLQPNSSTILTFTLGGATDTDVSLTGITVGEEVNVGITHEKDTGLLTIYQDGVAVESATMTDYPTLDLASSLYVGRREDNTDHNANMRIRDFQTFDFTATPNQLKYLAGET